eukprot:TRINITY_DN56745_c0_g1_i1.p1 TRINITY_DN56745_c0_g1~~TRINITY_DN56745_c0_g1_i1.p1  ORF type:complete len:182 (-),score=108.44 TRINITY_DN56745_c0_g1_i1:178-690(-)
MSASSSSSSSSSVDLSELKVNDPPTPMQMQHLTNVFQTLRSHADQLSTKIGELDAERAEHALVVKAIKDLDPKRRCFRLVGGVLVERTVEEVLPALQKNMEQISTVMGKLQGQLKDKQQNIAKFQAKFGHLFAEQKKRMEEQQRKLQEQQAQQAAQMQQQTQSQGAGVLA